MAGRKLHAVVCAYPALGHINPLLHLSSLLAAKGIRITFVTTHFFCDRLRGRQAKGQAPEEAPKQLGQEQGEEASLPPQRKGSEEESGGQGEEAEAHNGEEQGSISFEGLPDGLPSNFDRTSPSTELSKAVDHLHSAFEELMRSLMHSTSPVPSLLISDAFVPWTHDVASALLIPRALFWPQSITVFTIFAHTELLLINGINPFQEDLDAAPTRLVDFLPGVPALPASYLPYRIKPVGGQDRRFLLSENLAKQSEQCKEVTWILANSFNNLEGLLLNVLQNNVGVSMKLLGPLLPLSYLEGQLPQQHMHAGEIEDILQWLHTQAVASILYISLGSVVTWTPEQVMEVGLGLLAKKQAFLWVMHPWEVRLALPQGLLKLGKIVKFAPQLQVLGHPAIGGFMSHCGWNSTLESLSMGVPILAWPHFFDQFTNCWYVVHVWKVGVELHVVRRGGIEAIVDRCEIERAVTLLMQAEDGRLMRSRASKIRDSAEYSVLSGSSHKNFEDFLSELVPESCST